MQHLSFPMRALRSIGYERFAWSLRRLHCPVPADALVLEVGSGGNPYPRSNVLLDAYEQTRERHWVKLRSDRPTVLGFVEDLPFRDNSFDFVIASHVLEHSTDPERFLLELQRVAKAGYIEVPDAFMERINPYRDHRLEITVQNGKLIIRKKANWIVEPETVALYERQAKILFTKELVRKYPFSFHVRFYWRDTIPFHIINPDTKLSWAPLGDSTDPVVIQVSKIRSLIQKVLSVVYFQFRRNKAINLADLIQCPKCKSTNLEASDKTITCCMCESKYEVRNGIPDLKK